MMFLRTSGVGRRVKAGRRTGAQAARSLGVYVLSSYKTAGKGLELLSPSGMSAPESG
jgi:hypothetical protein